MWNEKDKQDQQKQDDKQANKDQKAEAQPKPDDISKEEANRILNELNKSEQDLQKDLQKKKVKANVVKIEKDW